MRRAVDAVSVSTLVARYIRDVLVAVRFHHMTLVGATLRGTEDVLAGVRCVAGAHRITQRKGSALALPPSHSHPSIPATPIDLWPRVSFPWLISTCASVFLAPRRLLAPAPPPEQR